MDSCAPDGFWENYVEQWKAILTPFIPYPSVTADKLACLNWQHLLYVSFVAMEAACNGELEDSEEEGVLLCREGRLSLEDSAEGQATWTGTFGIENSALGCPAVPDAFASVQVGALKYMREHPDRKMLAIIEGAVEDWLDEKLAPDWNIYLELAEMGELSEESSRLLEKVQRRLAVFRRKTIRSHLSNSKPSAAGGGAKAAYIRRQTRRRRMASEPIAAAPRIPEPPAAPVAAVTTPDVEAPTHVEEGAEC